MQRDVPDAMRRIAAELAKPAPAGVYAIAAKIIRDHVPGAAAILAYGSCIRDTSLDESLVDLYVLTHRLDDVSRSIVSRFACRLLPPNVYYAECPHSGGVLRSKYSVMPLSDFVAWTASNTLSPYFWARFAQPSRLIFAADDGARRKVIAAVAEGALTLLRESRRMARPGEDALASIVRCLQASYATELRAERAARAELIAEASRDYFSELASLVQSLGGAHDPVSAERAWWRRRVNGKLLSVARLIKAGFTFEGGADYLAWKIRRHSGEIVVMNSWHRRHPVLTGLMLLPKMLRKGAVR